MFENPIPELLYMFPHLKKDYRESVSYTSIKLHSRAVGDHHILVESMCYIKVREF